MLAADTNWNQGLELAIIAGCSLVDITHAQVLPDPTAKPIDNRAPGKALVAAGSSVVVGYNWKAPLDDQYGHSDYTAEIAKDYLDRYKTDRAIGDLSAAALDWITSNYIIQDRFAFVDHSNMNARGRAADACGIYAVEGDEANWVYYYIDWTTGTTTRVPRSQWP